ncbi:MAG: DUF2914 domain-containing protein, partial [Alphaproteobacteria bacterium]|nr:DUF2914 domain-containing protein [Alphaproteobacteria bacterium]
NVKITTLGFATAAIFAISLIMPVTLNLESGFTTNGAYAANGGGGKGNGGNGGGNGGGNSGGGNGGGGNGGSGGSGGSNGGGGGNGSNNGGGDVSSTGSGRDTILFIPPKKEEISLALFTTKISKRYPADEVTILDDSHQAISFFSELKEMSGKMVSHIWYYGDEVKFRTNFKIRANSWRIWSTQLLPESMSGEWKVEIVDEAGKVLQVRKLNYAPEDVGILARK